VSNPFLLKTRFFAIKKGDARGRRRRLLEICLDFMTAQKIWSDCKNKCTRDVMSDDTTIGNAIFSILKVKFKKKHVENNILHTHRVFIINFT
jgi:hypothetical protein